MSIKQAGDCIQCGGACADICPSGVFEVMQGSGGYGRYYPARVEDCVECGACVDECAGGVLELSE